jgi:hypothetical protein
VNNDVDNLYKFFDQQMFHLKLSNIFEVDLKILKLHQHYQQQYLKIQQHHVDHVNLRVHRKIYLNKIIILF